MKKKILIAILFLATVSLYSQYQTKKYALFNTEGQQISLPYTNILKIESGFFLVQNKDKGLINWQGKEILPCKYSNISVQAKYVIYKKTKDENTSFNNEKDDSDSITSVLVSPISSDLLSFGKCGVIDTTGQEILPPEYRSIYYSNNRFFVKQPTQYTNFGRTG